jgi:hypothetical protein
VQHAHARRCDASKQIAIDGDRRGFIARRCGQARAKQIGSIEEPLELDRTEVVRRGVLAAIQMPADEVVALLGGCVVAVRPPQHPITAVAVHEQRKDFAQVAGSIPAHGSVAERGHDVISACTDCHAPDRAWGGNAGCESARSSKRTQPPLTADEEASPTGCYRNRARAFVAIERKRDAVQIGMLAIFPVFDAARFRIETGSGPRREGARQRLQLEIGYREADVLLGKLGRAQLDAGAVRARG